MSLVFGKCNDAVGLRLINFSSLILNSDDVFTNKQCITVFKPTNFVNCFL